jgi:Uma2 family endonuclease
MEEERNMVVRYADPVDDEMSEDEYRRFALSDGNGQWELVNGRLREKPPMSAKHGDLMFELGHALRLQLDRRDYRVRSNHGQLRISPRNYFVPDLVVIPSAVDPILLGQPDALDAYSMPLPLVVEIWSPSTGSYDADTKLPDYQARGDLEIWRIHPRERTLTTWVRQADATYRKIVYTGGIVRLAFLPGVTIDLDALFDD